jgi:hypothetical protein
MILTNSLLRVAMPMLFLFTALLAIPGSVGAVESWVPFDTKALGTTADVGRNQNALVFNPANNEPYAVYTDWGDSYKISVKRYTGASWVTVGNSGFGNVSNNSTSLAFHPVTNEPYVSFADNVEGKVSVYRLSGSSWVPVGNTAFSVGYQALATTLAFNPVTKEPYVMYLDRGVPSDEEVPLYCPPSAEGGNELFTAEEGASPSPEEGVGSVVEGCVSASESGGANQIVVMKFNGISWVQIGGAFDSFSSNPLSLAFDPITATPYVAYVDGISHQIRIRRFDGSSWVAINSPGVGTWADMMFNPSTNEPYVAYLDESCGASYGWKATVKKYSGSTWVPVGNQCVGEGVPWEIDLEFSPTNSHPYLAYISAHYSANDVFRPTVVTLDGSLWKTVANIAPNASGPYGINLAIKPSTGVPYVMYRWTSETGGGSGGGENNATSTTQSCDWNPAFGTLWDASKKNLVVITHGWNASSSDAWVQNLGESICNNVDNTSTSVRVFDWQGGAKTGLGVLLDAGEKAKDAYYNASLYGRDLYRAIIAMQPIPEHIHLIAHSAGSNVIQTAVDELAEYYKGKSKKPFIHLTFLDGYSPKGDGERYGDLTGNHSDEPDLYRLPGYAEQYVTMDDAMFTYSQFAHTANFDVTYLNPVKSAWPKDLDNLIQEHLWPVVFYHESITPSTFKTIQGNGIDTFNMGFPFSEESAQVNRLEPSRDHIGDWCIVTNVSEPYRRCLVDRRYEKRDVILTDPNKLATIHVPAGSDKYLVDVSQFVGPMGNDEVGGILPHIIIQNPDGATIDIPHHTEIMSTDVTWNGIIKAPEVILHKNWFGLGSTVAVEVGFSGGSLFFDKAVAVRIKGQAGKQAGYTIDESDFFKIPKCLESQRYGDNLPGSSACSIDSDGDLLIWTKHFTTFVTYTEDTLPPTTALTTSGTSGPEWYRSDVVVTLTATDTPDGSGVASTTYSLDDGATWNLYTAPFTLTGEGEHTVLYRSTDKAGNTEDVKTATLYIDLTAPEAKLSANILSKDLLVTGNDNMGETTVLKTTTGYTITDEAGHTTKLFVSKKWAGKTLTMAQLNGIQYDNAPVVTFPKTQLLYAWTPWKGATNLTNQTVHVNKTFTVTATYLKPLDSTTITISQNRKRIKPQTFPGLKLVTLTTEKGVVGYEL